MKIWTNDRSNNVHTQKAPLQHRATIHCATRTTLASLCFGCYPCLLYFLYPLISRRGLFATWKVLDEIYKIYMLLHRADLNISEIFRQCFRIVQQILPRFVMFEFFSLMFAQILTNFCRNFADILEMLKFSEILNFLAKIN